MNQKKNAPQCDTSNQREEPGRTPGTAEGEEKVVDKALKHQDSKRQK